ncbi:MAG: MalY/PatB family protein [Lachnospiraceae bacterium]
MNYDFDRIVDRKNTNDIKWHSKAVESYLRVPIPEDIIPMWLADMDFACPPGLVAAMRERCDKEIFGYCSPMESFMHAVCYWQQEQHGFTVDPGWLGVIPTVVAGINVAIRAFTEEGDGIIIQQPVYDPFSSIIQRAGRTVVNNALLSEDNYYTINFPELEQMAADPRNKMMVLCSPHNPVGRVWTKDELIRIADICRDNDVLLVTDEIHSDLVFYGHTHHPLLALKPEYQDHVIMLTSPGKTFNVAGLKMAVSIIPNPDYKKAFEAMTIALSLDIKNTFGIESVIYCYTAEGAAWKDELVTYIEGNFEMASAYLEQNLPTVKFVKPEGTYLIWLDFTDTGLSDEELLQKVILKSGVICVPGTWFGPGGERHIRFNAGCPRSIMIEALKRIEEAVNRQL